MPSVPTDVRILAVLSVLAGVALLVAGTVALTGVATFASGHGISDYLGMVIGAALLLLGFGYLVAAAGFLAARAWSWTLAFTTYGVGLTLTLGVIALAPSASLIGTVVGLGHLVVPILTAVLIYLLTSPEVKVLLRRTRPLLTRETIAR